MSNVDEKKDIEIFRELIEAEESKALAKFRASQFRERLEDRISSAPASSPRPSLFQVIPRLFWVSLIILLIVGLMEIILVRLRAPAPGGRAAVEAVLRQLPGMRALENQARAASGLSSLPLSSLERGITSILSNPKASAGAATVPARNQGFSAINPKKVPMDLWELYNMLILDKSVEHVLTAFSQKTKEG